MRTPATTRRSRRQLVFGFGPLALLLGSLLVPVSAAVTATPPFAGAYVLDVFGGVHAQGSTVPVTATASWLRPVAEGLVTRPDGTSGYVLDNEGGVHPFGVSGDIPTVPVTTFQGTSNIARSIILDPCDPTATSGYVLDGYGAIHPFGGAPTVTTTASWSSWDIARSLAATCHNGQVAGLVLDGEGGLHPFASSPLVLPTIPAPTLSWSFDIARTVVLEPSGTAGYVLDGWGGVHPFGGAPPVTATGYWAGLDVARTFTLAGNGISGWVFDAQGRDHPFGPQGSIPAAFSSPATWSWSAVAPPPASPALPTLPMQFLHSIGPPSLAAGSNPSVLPGPVLIADEDNNQLLVVNPRGAVVWRWPQPGDLARGQTFVAPDDAFFTPDGKEIIATQETDSVISVIDIATRKLVYRYGTAGVPGMTANHLSNPDDAMMLPDGYVLAPDIKNCRIVLLHPGSSSPVRIYGLTTNACFHAPPMHFGSPNGAFPLSNGHYLVTEINGVWANEMGLNGTIYSSFHIPGVTYPSDTNEVAPGLYLTVDYSSPGTIEEFRRSGAIAWRYHPLGAAALDHPSLALPLPNGDVIFNDDFNNRVAVVDPHTNRIVWQYGSGIAGSAPGQLNNPDGIDLAPPYSLLVRHAKTMGLP